MHYDKGEDICGKTIHMHISFSITGGHFGNRLNTEHWKVLDRQSEPKGQRLIMHIDRDSLVTIRSTGYKIFTGFSQGTVKVLKDPEAPKAEAVLDTTSSKLTSEGEGDDIPASSDDRLVVVESPSTDQGPPSIETQSEEGKLTREERMETDSPPKDKKIKHTKTPP